MLAVPSTAFREVLGHVRGTAPILSLVKGLDPETGDRLSTLVRDRPVAVLSGPNMAEEVGAGLPGATVIATEDEELARLLQDAINSLAFRVYVNTDLTGVELCGAAKNVIALAAGGVDGLGLGDNAKAALITRGLVEMARLGEAAGGETETFFGLAGMGDLIVHLLAPLGPQPPRRRADRARSLGRPRPRRDRPGGRGADDGARPPRPLAPARDRAADHRGRLCRARGAAAERARWPR